jgi:ribosomal protein S18 acetylase RimI-like enzyme
VTTETLERLQSPKLSIPLFIEFEDDSNSKVGEKLSVRHMRPEDIQKVMPMCIEEFGQGSTMSLLDFPFYDYRKISHWWDRVYFEPTVSLSFRSKLNANLNPGPKAKDPTMLVLCRSCESINSREDVIGIVEVSLQAPEADKNPPPFPVPLWFKALYCRLTGNRPVGWVGNLLIDPRYRGLGYSKILMAATEGIAMSWDCHYMYLHADADYRSGKTAQSLYKGLGYEVVTDRGPEYSWMTGNAADNNPFSSIRIIEGVPLLCFYKRLQS